MCNKVRDLVYSDRRIKVEEIANALHISYGSVSTTLHDRLGMHKVTGSQNHLAMSNGNQSISIKRIVEAV